MNNNNQASKSSSAFWFVLVLHLVLGFGIYNKFIATDSAKQATQTEQAKAIDTP